MEQLSTVYFNFIDDTTPEHRKAQNRALFQYLVGTEYFVEVGKYEFQVHENWQDKLSILKSYCNNEHKHLTLEESKKLFNTRKNKEEYARVISDTKYEKKIALISEGIELTEEYDISDNIEERIKIDQPYQQIFSGAPGTGKSYELNTLAKKYFKSGEKFFYERVTFHPNMNYGQFVGVFKPFPSGEESAPVTYKFVPGTLLRQLEKAYRHPDKNFLILVEEINRANVASVFGDTFQLLDRENGESEYPIAISEDIKYRFFDENEGIFKDNATIPRYIKEKLENQGLFFPDNFYIWATMNGADQGVMPMDTAFKRRWEFVKFGVNDISRNMLPFFEDKYIKYNGGRIHWNSFRIAINNKLLELNISEDKLIGPYFIPTSVLEKEKELTESFKSKVLLYLFEDVVKMIPQRLFRLEANELHYSSLVSEFEKNGLDVFVDLMITDSEINEEQNSKLDTTSQLTVNQQGNTVE